MNTSRLFSLLMAFSLALAASGLRAQTADATPPPMAPVTVTPWQVDFTFPYAVQWHTAGVVADAGYNWMNHFFGFEYSYYDGYPHGYAYYAPGTGVYQGLLNYRTGIMSYNAVYRYSYFVPVAGLAPSALKLYAGGSAGIATANYYPSFSTSTLVGVTNAVSTYQTSSSFDFTLFAGADFAVTPNLGFKLGFRYIQIAHTYVFYNATTKLDACGPEMGISWRF